MPKIFLIEENNEVRTLLEQRLRAQGFAVTAVATLDEVRGSNGNSTPSSPRKLRELEKIAIEEALRENHGNRTHAARQLGISLRKLQYRLKEYGQREIQGPQAV